MTHPVFMIKHVSKLLAFLSIAVLMLLTVALAPMFSQAESGVTSAAPVAAAVSPPGPGCEGSTSSGALRGAVGRGLGSTAPDD